MDSTDPPFTASTRGIDPTVFTCTAVQGVIMSPLLKRSLLCLAGFGAACAVAISRRRFYPLD